MADQYEQWKYKIVCQRCGGQDIDTNSESYCHSCKSITALKLERTEPAPYPEQGEAQ